MTEQQQKKIAINTPGETDGLIDCSFLKFLGLKVGENNKEGTKEEKSQTLIRLQESVAAISLRAELLHK